MKPSLQHNLRCTAASDRRKQRLIQPQPSCLRQLNSTASNSQLLSSDIKQQGPFQELLQHWNTHKNIQSHFIVFQMHQSWQEIRKGSVLSKSPWIKNSVWDTIILQKRLMLPQSAIVHLHDRVQAWERTKQG